MSSPNPRRRSRRVPIASRARVLERVSRPSFVPRTSASRVVARRVVVPRRSRYDRDSPLARRASFARDRASRRVTRGRSRRRGTHRSRRARVERVARTATPVANEVVFAVANMARRGVATGDSFRRIRRPSDAVDRGLSRFIAVCGFGAIACGIGDGIGDRDGIIRHRGVYNESKFYYV
jgi:hypothetical protein